LPRAERAEVRRGGRSQVTRLALVVLRSKWRRFVRYLFLFLAFMFIVIWFFAFIAFHVAKFFVHFFLLLALVFFVVHLLRPRRSP
jgi:hypothetical protein